MIPWLVRRVATSLLLIAVLLTVVFFVVRLAPGDPLDQTLGENTNLADREMMAQRLGLTGGLGEQYLAWVGGVLRGDWGHSVRQQRPVARIVGEALPATLLLTVTAYLLHLLLATVAALTMSARRGSAVDHLVQTTGLTFYSLPGFWLGLMFILVFGRLLGWLPTAGMQAPDAAFLSPPARALDVLRHLVLPVLTLALGTFMGTARYLRAALDDILSRDHILAARARGVPERDILLRHALRGAMLPMVTLLGLHLPFLLGGAVVVETVFSWPGLGRIAVEAIWARDYPVIMATSAISAILVVCGSLLADVLYHWADPRVRRADQGERP